jgi:hypothetical protein
LCDLAAAISGLRSSSMPANASRHLIGFGLRQAGDNQEN